MYQRTLLLCNYLTGCDPQHLSDGTPLQDGTSCGAPYHSLGIENGIICYNGIDAGATALYICSSSTSTSISSPSVRTCMPNGTWSGSVLHCDHGWLYELHYNYNLTMHDHELIAH